MDEEIERLVVQVRADTAGFAKDVSTMKAELDGSFAQGVERAGDVLGNALSSAIRRGSLDFEDLKRTAMAIISDIANAAISNGLGGLFGGGSQGLLGIGNSVLSALLGAPGRATGGPVTSGRAYRVGEQGPEYFIPAAAGRIEPSAGTTVTPNVHLTIHVSDNGQSSAPDQLRRSGRQVARSIRSALASRN
ncbi:MAG: tail tape measure protein [Pseudomonadota bacterium]